MTLGEFFLRWGRVITLLVIPKHLVDLACDLAKRYGKELAGLGVGFVGGGEKVVVEDIILGENLSEESDRFYLDPAAIVEAFKYSELGECEVVALIHTHKSGATPSQLDIEGMELWPIPWIIIDETECLIRAWVLEEKNLRELGVKMVFT